MDAWKEGISWLVNLDKDNTGERGNRWTGKEYIWGSTYYHNGISELRYGTVKGLVAKPAYAPIMLCQSALVVRMPTLVTGEYGAQQPRFSDGGLGHAG